MSATFLIRIDVPDSRSVAHDASLEAADLEQNCDIRIYCGEFLAHKEFRSTDAPDQFPITKLRV